MHEVNNSETSRIANRLELAQIVAAIAVYICALLYSNLCGVIGSEWGARSVRGNLEGSACYLDSRGVLFGAVFYLLNFRLWKIISKRFLVSDSASVTIGSSSDVVPQDPLMAQTPVNTPARTSSGNGIAFLAFGKMGILLAAISLTLTASNALIISSLAGFTAVMILGIFLAPIFLRRKQRG